MASEMAGIKDGGLPDSCVLSVCLCVESGTCQRLKPDNPLLLQPAASSSGLFEVLELLLARRSGRCWSWGQDPRVHETAAQLHSRETSC